MDLKMNSTTLKRDQDFRLCPIQALTLFITWGLLLFSLRLSLF